MTIAKKIATQSLKTIISSPIEKASANVSINKKAWLALSKYQKSNIVALGILTTACLIIARIASSKINKTFSSII